jgi:hypothetical protein
MEASECTSKHQRHHNDAGSACEHVHVFAQLKLQTLADAGQSSPFHSNAYAGFRSFLYNRGHGSWYGQTIRCGAIRSGNGSPHHRYGFRVLQKPILGTADSEHWRCLGVRSFLFEILQASMSTARWRLLMLRSCRRNTHLHFGVYRQNAVYDFANLRAAKPPFPRGCNPSSSVDLNTSSFDGLLISGVGVMCRAAKPYH